jgi:glycosyltransferase involved in cell wall biosynthesis
MNMANNRADKTKRHCMVVYARYPLGETRVQREAEALIDHGYEVDVICPRIRGEPTVDNHRGVQIYREFCLPARLGGGLAGQFLRYFRFLVSVAITLTRLHKQRPYDTIQIHNLPDFLVFSALIPKLSGVPVILDLHDLMPEFYAGRFGHHGNSWLVRLIRWQERLACGFADHVITVSEHWRQALIERGVSAHKCSVVMNVADDNIFHLPEDGRPHLPDNFEFRLIYHGTIVYRYGLDLAIRAIDQVRHDIPDIHLTILGGGHYVPALIQMTRELDLGNHVTIYDKLRPAEELPEIIWTADVGIVPYRNDAFTDGLLPTKLMEYAALGVPAIAARTSAIKAYFSDTMVEFFEPGDADDLARCICRLYKNRERLAELAQGCRKFNQRYNWNKIGAEYVAFVERLGTR